MHRFPSRPGDWPVRFILDGGAWRRGYDLAMELADGPTRRLVNPFDPGLDEFYGFEDGRQDAERLRGGTCTSEASEDWSTCPFA
jgi:hypothetical protein